MVTKNRQSEFTKAFREYLKVRKKAFATVDKKKWKKVERLQEKLAKATKKAEKTMDPVLVEEMDRLENQYLSLLGVRL